MVSNPYAEHGHGKMSKADMLEHFKNLAEAFGAKVGVLEAQGAEFDDEDEKGSYILVRSERSGAWVGVACCRKIYGSVVVQHLIEARRVLTESFDDDVSCLAVRGAWADGSTVQLGPETNVELVGVYETHPVQPEAEKILRALPEWK